jgi:hypothetical protein
MTKFGKLAAGSIVGAALTLSTAGVAVATPSTAPTTTGPTTTAPAGTTPTTTPGPAKKAAPRVMTGAEIWVVVHPHHAIDCAHAAGQITRIQAAITAATKRQGRWQAKSNADQKATGAQAAKRAKRSSGRLKGFTKLAHDGQALITRIDTKCGLTAPTA